MCVVRRFVKEDAMLDKLMKNGSYRVDYFSPHACGSDDAYGFYVRGDVSDNDAYSISAKRHLYAGLLVIEETLGMKNLVGIYVDVDRAENMRRPAYQAMKSDIRKGYFKQIFVMCPEDLLDDQNCIADLLELENEVGSLTIITYNEDTCLLENVDIEIEKKLEGLCASVVLW